MSPLKTLSVVALLAWLANSPLATSLHRTGEPHRSGDMSLAEAPGQPAATLQSQQQAEQLSLVGDAAGGGPTSCAAGVVPRRWRAAGSLRSPRADAAHGTLQSQQVRWQI